MLRRPALAIVIAALFVPAALAGTSGNFGGKVVKPAAVKNPPGKWLYITGRPGMLRRVEISNTRFEYAESVPRAARAPLPAADLKDGTLVQVTAEQDKAGEWIAQSVLILRLANQGVPRGPSYPPAELL
ncbi:MAG: hypothetical protein HYX28_01810 [Candidatus Koribacter versatilis]|uniref:DUF5666 domain-containing protein n=1 Tax=Candidatus Korobacter versatilis TaxID=658062 RepID=A0A932A6A3_9BACT|nr:hypothetical protein [Candidatus Koribacter versatilis]